MKVLFLSQIVPYPPHGGVLQRGYNLVRELGREARVHLLAFVHPDVLPTEAACCESRAALEKFCEAVEYFPLWPKASPLHRVAGLAVGALSPRPFSVLAHRSAAFHRRVSELIATKNFDVIHVDTIALARFLDKRWSIPAVLTHHNIESQLMERRAGAERGLLARLYLRRETQKLLAYEAKMSGSFDVNVFVSKTDEKTLLERVPGLRTAIVPNGVDVEYFTPNQGKDMPALIYTGGMNMFANRDAVMFFLNEIWPLIRKQVPDVRFFAVGQDPPKELLDLAARDPHVVVTGYVTDVRPLVCDASVYVVPLRVGGGTRLKVLDAMAMGKAMVSTSIGCEGLDVRPDEHLLVADSPEQFAEKTVRLLQDPGRRLTLGRTARELVERRYSWRTIGGQLLEAYRIAIENRRQAR
ncbi:glycosyltransferase [Nitrospira sp. NS4]|uniref:glycosyltransferase n=1 Tax=Nitrospira sp. NS4 TaxID=3414498 RepID=UPI003C2ECCE1